MTKDTRLKNCRTRKRDHVASNKVSPPSLNDDCDDSASRSVCRPASNRNRTLKSKSHTTIYNSESEIDSTLIDSAQKCPFSLHLFQLCPPCFGSSFSMLQDTLLLPSIVLFNVFPQLLIRLIFLILFFSASSWRSSYLLMLL